MGVALAAIADDSDFLALDQVEVGVAIVINTHGRFLEAGQIGRLVRLLGINPPVARKISGVV
jgi:hypothetical protein